MGRRNPGSRREVVYLMDGPGDAAQLAAASTEALKECDTLRRDLDEAIQSGRSDWEKLAVGNPNRLMQIREQVDYRAAWVRL
jgi:hypothetical protein